MMTASKPIQHFDVCVIGGGPAGSALAIRLAQLGHEVCVIERSAFPRRHIGESLTPGIWPQLELLSTDRTIALTGFWPCRTALVQWESESAVRRDFGSAGGLLVDRGRFDALLLDQARAQGVRVMQPAFVRAHSGDDHGWSLEVQFAGERHRLATRFLADATGRTAFLRGRKQRTGPRTLALYGYWRGRNLPREPRVQASSDSWFWGVPLPDHTYNAMVFVDAVEFRSRRTDSLTATYHDLIGQSDLLAGCSDARLAGPVCAVDATPYVDSDNVDLCSIKVGDAALALDPLSSSGVQKAINTALVGAVVVNTLLRHPERADAAKRFYSNNLSKTADRHRRWASGYYARAARVGRFWQSRANGGELEPDRVGSSMEFSKFTASDVPVALSPQAAFVDEPCIVGDFIAIRPTLRHPQLERPVAFLGDWNVAGLLKHLQPGMTLRMLMETWQIPDRSKRVIADWLISRRVLMPQNLRNPPKGDCYDRT